MSSRRQFFKHAALGGATFAAATVRTFYFPKPVNAYSLDYLLSVDAPSGVVFNNFLAANVVRDATPVLPDADRAVIAAVEKAQVELTANSFNNNPTPFAQRRNSNINPLWGRQRNEELGPNPGFGTVQIVNNLASPITFTGSTTAGIDSAIRILGTDENLDPLVLDNALIPVQEQFEDWGTWGGDVDPRTGQVINTTSLTSYATRMGSVLRRYEVKEPGKGGFGIIIFDVDGGRTLQTRITVTVRFA